MLTVVVALALISTGCGRSISYLNDEQNDTLNSARVVEGTEDRVYEIDYTADYKMNEFIDTISKKIIEYVNGQMIVNKYPLKVQYNENDDTMQIQYPEKETGYLISTNFYVSEGFNNTKNDSGKWRYETLEKAMSENTTPTKEQLRDITKWKTSSTLNIKSTNHSHINF